MSGFLIVTDSSVLIGLDRIGRIDILPATFPDVVAPPAVVAEYGAAPEWLRVLPVSDPAVADALVLQRLDAGEREAIALAQEYPGSLLLIDERRGRRYALAAGLQVVGTAGVLVQAKRSRAVTAVRPLLDALRRHDFRLSDAVYRQVLAAAGEAG